MQLSTEFCKAFNYSWNKNLDEYIERTNMRFDNNLRVVYRKERIMKEVPPFSDDALKYFYETFNGPVCDEEHWECFKECMTHVYKTNGFINDFKKNYAVFEKYWNDHSFDFYVRFINEPNGRRIFVVRGKDLLMCELESIPFQCFYKVFNGRVCDYDHWQYFERCLKDAESMTEIYAGIFSFKGKVN